MIHYANNLAKVNWLFHCGLVSWGDYHVRRLNHMFRLSTLAARQLLSQKNIIKHHILCKVSSLNSTARGLWLNVCDAADISHQEVLQMKHTNPFFFASVMKKKAVSDRVCKTRQQTGKLVHIVPSLHACGSHLDKNSVCKWGLFPASRPHILRWCCR